MFLLVLLTLYSQGTVKDVLDSRQDLSMMRTMVGSRANDLLNIPPLVTFFPPADSAFAGLPIGATDLLQTEPSYSEALINLHLITGVSITQTGIISQYGNRGVGLYTSDLNSRLDISVVDNVMNIKTETEKDISQSTAEVAVNNGVVQVLNKVLYTIDTKKSIPTQALTDEGVLPSIFRSILLASGVTVPTDRSVTIFAPSDDAFIKVQITSASSFQTWPQSVLARFVRYLMVDGYKGDTTLQNSNGQEMNTFDQNNKLTVFFTATTTFINTSLDESAAIVSNATATNGIAQVISKLLLPPGVTLPTNSLVVPGVLPSMFLNAVKVALLSDVLTSTNLTVFAPDDAAFSTIGVKKHDDLFTFAFSDLQKLVKNHFVRGIYTVDRLQAGGQVSLTTLNLNSALAVKAAATVEVTALQRTALVTSNVTGIDGVGHILNLVLLPDGVSGISQNAQQGASLTLLDVVLVIALAIFVVIGGVYVLYKGSITMYLKQRKLELAEQERHLNEEAMRDDVTKKSLGRNHNGFRALGAPQEEDPVALNLNQSNLDMAHADASGGVMQKEPEPQPSFPVATPAELMSYQFPDIKEEEDEDEESVISSRPVSMTLTSALTKTADGTGASMMTGNSNSNQINRSFGQRPPPGLGRGRRYSYGLPTTVSSSSQPNEFW
eukprot:TRINITY_DN10400_c0_g2_i1.p1 TRINITY_DN10400_c0_g2~~TRINITY_DN10400_c0_g2_i1.p1  ORF type:complete len:665 (+),score=132.54 TRINITY_DN10400_c0_g2_i1:55-2049(+)